MVAEAAADSEYQSSLESEKSSPDTSSKKHLMGQGQDVHPLSRSFTTSFIPTNRGEGFLHVQSWRDYINGTKGKKFKIYW